MAMNIAEFREAMESDMLRQEAMEEVWALRHLSYTGTQADLGERDVEEIADLISRLISELEKARRAWWRERGF